MHSKLCTWVPDTGLSPPARGVCRDSYAQLLHTIYVCMMGTVTVAVTFEVFGSSKMEKQVNGLPRQEKASVSSLVPSEFQLQLWVSRWVHKGEWKWNHVPGALSFTMTLPQRRPSRRAVAVAVVLFSRLSAAAILFCRCRSQRRCCCCRCVYV